MTKTNLHQEHHIIERQAFGKSGLLKELSKRNLFNLDSPRNLLNLPQSRDLAAKLGVSPHQGGPLKAYSEGLAGQLQRLQGTKDYRAMLSGDKAAGQRLAGRVNGLMDTLKAGLVNGDLYTNTPKGLSDVATNAKISSFFGDLDGYTRKHAAQIGKLGKLPAPEAKWAAALKSKKALETTVDALQKAGVKLGKGPAAATLEELAGAVVVSGKQSLLSATSLTTLKNYYASLPVYVKKGVRVSGPAATALGISVSVAEAAQQAKAGDAAGAIGTLARLAGALYFGAKGMALGAAGGMAAGGPLVSVIGGVIGGVAGAVGGEMAVQAIMTGATQLIDKVADISASRPSRTFANFNLFNMIEIMSNQAVFNEIRTAIKNGPHRLNALAQQVSEVNAPRGGPHRGSPSIGPRLGSGDDRWHGATYDRRGASSGRSKSKQRTGSIGISFPKSGQSSTGRASYTVDHSSGGRGVVSKQARDAVSRGRGGLYPVALDLDGDGVLDIRPLEPALSGGPLFDADCDGTPDSVAWVGPSDGLLTIDLGADGEQGPDGTIDQTRELAFALWKTQDEIATESGTKSNRPVTDLEGLRWAFDTNGDNVLDPHDDRWNEFRIWQDHNQNGASDPGELRTMEEARVAFIELLPSSKGSRLFADGSAITGTSSFGKTDGTAGLAADVVLSYRSH
ncbi:AHH domain-containing protein [Nitratireductor sp.]|uniref:AHH domain-containing protein n=1 Tax=Nitratireductor sp. TaxID=1872084 RepID=UPI002616562C|nr:AHH domain-containing protein [Nitratireductor sp.]MCV0380518.1 AHH domain-containing protein [Nitratireductor sp.]